MIGESISIDNFLFFSTFDYPTGVEKDTINKYYPQYCQLVYFSMSSGNDEGSTRRERLTDDRTIPSRSVPRRPQGMCRHETVLLPTDCHRDAWSIMRKQGSTNAFLCLVPPLCRPDDRPLSATRCVLGFVCVFKKEKSRKADLKLAFLSPMTPFSSTSTNSTDPIHTIYTRSCPHRNSLSPSLLTHMTLLGSCDHSAPTLPTTPSRTVAQSTSSSSASST